MAGNSNIYICVYQADLKIHRVKGMHHHVQPISKLKLAIIMVAHEVSRNTTEGLERWVRGSELGS